MLNFAGYLSGAISGQHIHLAADAKLTRQVNARLNREAGIGDDLALVFGFQVVHVGAVAMDAYANRMPGAMSEILRQACRGNMSARGLVYFPSGNLAPGSECFLYLLDSSVTGVTHNIEYLHLFF